MTTETVQKAMKLAAERYGGNDGVFNSAGFASAMAELAGLVTHVNLMDGKLVEAILTGRSDVEALSGGAHWRYRHLDDVGRGVRIICVDFDGVIHGYQSGWQGALEIPDPPVPDALDWLTSMVSDSRFKICIYSSRSKEGGAIEAMRTWFRSHGMSEETLAGLSFPTQKPAAVMTIDDRAFCFAGTFPTKQWLIDFQPWNKKRR
jgi:hypothetical protein